MELFNLIDLSCVNHYNVTFFRHRYFNLGFLFGIRCLDYRLRGFNIGVVLWFDIPLSLSINQTIWDIFRGHHAITFAEWDLESILASSIFSLLLCILLISNLLELPLNLDDRIYQSKSTCLLFNHTLILTGLHWFWLWVGLNSLVCTWYSDGFLLEWCFETEQINQSWLREQEIVIIKAWIALVVWFLLYCVGSLVKWLWLLNNCLFIVTATLKDARDAKLLTELMIAAFLGTTFHETLATECLFVEVHWIKVYSHVTLGDQETFLHVKYRHQVIFILGLRPGDGVLDDRASVVHWVLLYKEQALDVFAAAAFRAWVTHAVDSWLETVVLRDDLLCRQLEERIKILVRDLQDSWLTCELFTGAQLER